jgi:hypothetical protein
VSFYVSTANFFLLHCDEWDRVVALPRHKFVTGATLLQLGFMVLNAIFNNISVIPWQPGTGAELLSCQHNFLTDLLTSDI